MMLLHFHLAALLAESEPNITNGLLVIGLLLVLLSITMGFRKRWNRNPTQPTAPEQLERTRQTRAMHGDLEQLMVEIEQMAKRMSAQLDNKAVQLERLIREADQRIEQLQGSQQPDSPEEPQTDEPSRLRSRWQETTTEQLPPAGDDHAQLTAQVYRLADSGMTATQIARQLDEHVGKVELVLGLRET